MKVVISGPPLIPITTSHSNSNSYHFPMVPHHRSSSIHPIYGNCRRRRTKLVSAATNQVADVEVTWQIVVGTLAGVTPFVVAGIEFTKRIVAQKKCAVCQGSGLVLRDNKYYFRCSKCGGFLPWQSWKRFFSG